MTRPIKGYEQQDALSGWRYVIAGMQRAGARAAVKRRYRRAERRAGKREAREQ